ncbi:MAG: hypothetical protein PF638_05595 [Candidatus Delongbacteria bacterium]|jgi:hypothetical protein|nr:hypothetical protein [Candidatus Delongbacteria bacterium]
MARKTIQEAKKLSRIIYDFKNNIIDQDELSRRLDLSLEDYKNEIINNENDFLKSLIEFVDSSKEYYQSVRNLNPIKDKQEIKKITKIKTTKYNNLNQIIENYITNHHDKMNVVDIVGIKDEFFSMLEKYAKKE